MAKLKTQRISVDGVERGELQFKIDINVGKDGTFTTTLPKDIATLFDAAGVKMQRNNLGNLGYFAHSTCDGLEQKVKEAAAEYMSREMTSERIIIKYCIKTRCSYAMKKNGEICPNPSEEWTGMGYGIGEDHDPFNFWRLGNVNINATNNSSFGFQIYAQPFVRRDYKYKSGKTKTEYTRMQYGGSVADEALKNGYYLRWLQSVPCISMPDGADEEELDYSENVCEFFVTMIKSICNLNEKIKDFLKPEAIQMIADKKMKLLG